MLNTASLYFLTVAQCGSFTKAAQKLYVSQSTISKQVAAFEAQIGEQLLVREHRLVRLTEAGKAVFHCILTAQEHWERTCSLLQQAKHTKMSPLRMGIPPGWSVEAEPLTFLTQYEAQHPEILCVFEQRAMSEMMGLLLTQQLDLVVCSQSEPLPSTLLEQRFAFDAHVVVYFNRKHPLAANEQPPADFQGTPCYIVEATPTQTYLNLAKKIVQDNRWNMVVTPQPTLESSYVAIDQCKGCILGTAQARALLSPRYRCYHYDYFVPIVLIWNKANYSGSVHLFVEEFTKWRGDTHW